MNEGVDALPTFAIPTPSTLSSPPPIFCFQEESGGRWPVTYYGETVFLCDGCKVVIEQNPEERGGVKNCPVEVVGLWYTKPDKSAVLRYCAGHRRPLGPDVARRRVLPLRGARRGSRK